MKVSASSIFMIRPAAFQYNAQTAVTNDFQSNITGLSPTAILKKAQSEFDDMVSLLSEKGIEVIVFEDTKSPIKPDAIFPNNWISLSQEGIITIFAMKTPNRQLEKRKDIVDYFEENYRITKEIDLSQYEDNDRALEGTGSIVFNHNSRKAYACLSPRTDLELFESYCKMIGYQPVTFHSYDASKKLIYHTNVVMCIGSGYVIIGMDSVHDKTEQEELIEHFSDDGLEVIYLSQEQLLHSFAGNMLQVTGANDENYLVMSRRAFDCLTDNQKSQLTKFVTLLPVPIDIIETIGGGSARCMMAEVYLDKK